VRFCDFINPLYDNLPCSSKDRFALEIFSALCGEANPKSANKEAPFSAALPEGLTGDDGTYRKRLYNGSNNKYKGLSSRIKEHVLEHQSKATFLKYCGDSIAADGLLKLCDAFGVITTASKEAMFSALFAQFVEFAKARLMMFQTLWKPLPKTTAKSRATDCRRLHPLFTRVMSS
jgi:hypothetical protein